MSIKKIYKTEIESYNSTDIINNSTVVGAKVTDALNNLKNNTPDTYTQIVYVNSTSPSTATIFDTVNPPITNNNALKNDVTNLYVGTDASTWVYQTSPAAYITKTITSTTSNFNLEGTSTDAGGNKTSNIQRTGKIKAGGFKVDGTLGLLKSDGTVDLTDYEKISNKNTANGYPGLGADNKILTSQLPLSKVKNSANVDQFTYALDQGIQFAGGGDTSVSFDATNKRVTITSIPGAGGGGAVTSFNGRTGGVVATEGDYSLNLLGDVEITSVTNNDFLQYDSALTQWRNRVLNTNVVPELTNLYYTNARGIGSVLTGYIPSPGTVLATDTILQAFNKVNGNINLKADVSALHNPITLGTQNGLSLAGQVLSLGLASNGVTGALSGTDWNTFNGKFPTPTGLTTNYLPKWNGTGFGNSQVFDNGSFVTIGSNEGLGSNLNVRGTIRNILKTADVGDTVFNGIQGISGGFQIAKSVGNVLTYSFYTGSNAIAQRITNTGNTLFGTTTDNGVDKVQVNGSGSFSGNLNVSGLIQVGDLSAGSDASPLRKRLVAKNYLGNVGGYIDFIDRSSTRTAYKTALGVQDPAGIASDLLVLDGQTMNVGIGTSTPTEKLDVVGNGKFSGTISASPATASNHVPVLSQVVTLTGNQTIAGIKNFSSPVIIPNGVNANEAVNKGQLDAVARPYKVYSALISQSGTNAPTIIVLENTLGATISMARQNTGHYRTTISIGNFPANKTFKFIQNGNYTITKQQILTAAVQVNTPSFDMYTEVDGVKTDDVLQNAAYEIRIYP